MTQLAPCPFCGSAPDETEIEPHSHGLGLRDIATGEVHRMPDHPGSWTIECHACAVGMIGEDRADVRARWNRRPALHAAAPRMLEALRRARLSAVAMRQSVVDEIDAAIAEAEGK